jgi:hypothetical protein
MVYAALSVRAAGFININLRMILRAAYLALREKQMPVIDAARADAIQVIETLQQRYTPGVKEPDSEFSKEFFKKMTAGIGLPDNFEAEYQSNLLDVKKRMFSRYENPTWFMLVSQFSERIEKALDKQAPDKKRKKILFGTLHTGRINGVAIGTKNPEYYVILLESGLFGFANLLAKGVAQAFPQGEKKSDGSFSISTEMDKVKQNIQADDDIATRLVDLVMAYIVAGDPHAARPYLPKKEYVALISIWRDAMEYFVLAHEYGHAVSGHLEASPATATSEGNEIPSSWKEEFEADYVGLVTTLNILMEDRLSPSLTYAGVEAFFLGLELIERALAVFQGREIREHGTASHPPAMMRREAMRHWLRQGLPEQESKSAIQLADIFQEVIELIWPRLEATLREGQRRGARIHPIWTNY